MATRSASCAPRTVGRKNHYGSKFLQGKRFLIHDRDPLFTGAFGAHLQAAGVQCLKLPPHSPNLNAFAERFVLSIKSECLNKIVPLGERLLMAA